MEVQHPRHAAMQSPPPPAPSPSYPCSVLTVDLQEGAVRQDALTQSAVVEEALVEAPVAEPQLPQHQTAARAVRDGPGKRFHGHPVVGRVHHLRVVGAVGVHRGDDPVMLYAAAATTTAINAAAALQCGLLSHHLSHEGPVAIQGHLDIVELGNCFSKRTKFW